MFFRIDKRVQNYDPGCEKTYLSFTQEETKINLLYFDLNCVCVLSVVSQLIGIFLSCCLSRYITNNQYEMV